MPYATDTRRPRLVYRRVRECQCTCFTGTKVLILTLRIPSVDEFASMTRSSRHNRCSIPRADAGEAPAYVSIRQQTSAYVSIRSVLRVKHAGEARADAGEARAEPEARSGACSGKRRARQTAATPAAVPAVLARAEERGQRGSDSTCIRQHTSAYPVSTAAHTSAYAISAEQRGLRGSDSTCMREHTLAYATYAGAAAIAPAYVSIR
jgi:hypothetical protein